MNKAADRNTTLNPHLLSNLFPPSNKMKVIRTENIITFGKGGREILWKENQSNTENCRTWNYCDTIKWLILSKYVIYYVNQICSTFYI